MEPTTQVLNQNQIFDFARSVQKAKVADSKIFNKLSVDQKKLTLKLAEALSAGKDSITLTNKQVHTYRSLEQILNNPAAADKLSFRDRIATALNRRTSKEKLGKALDLAVGQHLNRESHIQVLSHRMTSANNMIIKVHDSLLVDVENWKDVIKQKESMVETRNKLEETRNSLEVNRKELLQKLKANSKSRSLEVSNQVHQELDQYFKKIFQSSSEEYVPFVEEANVFIQNQIDSLAQSDNPQKKLLISIYHKYQAVLAHKNLDDIDEDLEPIEDVLMQVGKKLQQFHSEIAKLETRIDLKMDKIEQLKGKFDYLESEKKYG